MSYLKERVSYLKGLAEGMQLNDASNEGKLLKAIIDVLDDMALAIEDVEDVQDQLNEQIDSIDEDLAEIERVVFEDEDDDDIYLDEIECPYCGEKIEIEEDIFDDDADTIECPHCNKKIEIDWDCDCEDCDEHSEH